MLAVACRCVPLLVAVHFLTPQILVEGNHKCAKPGLCIARQFSKRYTIASDVNLDAITSRRTHDGVLQLAIPRANRRYIKVPVAEDAAPAALPDAAAPKMEEVTVEVESP